MAAKRSIEEYRADFPILQTTMHGKSLAYLDSGASAQKPQVVINAMNAVLESGYANIHRGLYELSQNLTEKFENTRTKVAKFIGAKENEIVFTRNTTEAINLVAQSWGRTFLKAGDEIIISEMEHHANIVPWQLLRDQIGVVIKIIPINDLGELDLEAFKILLSPKTRLVSVVHISNSLGTINPVKEINALAKNFNKDIKVLVDGSQSIVHGVINVADMGCDFFVFTGHKLYGPTGVGVLFGKNEILNSMPPYQGGGDMIDRVSFDKTTYKEAPFRFEAGTPAIVEVIGLGVAIDYVSAIGMDAIVSYETELAGYASKRLAEIKGLKLYGTAKHKAGIFSFTIDGAHPSDIGMVLDQCGVAVRAGHHCCMPLMARLSVDSTVRASLGLYSNKSDIDQLITGLEKVQGLFQ